MSDSISKQFGPTDRTKHQRIPARGSFEAKGIYEVIDEADVCSVGVVMDGQAFVIPMAHVRVRSKVYFHGSHQSRLMTLLEHGGRICLSFTVIDAMVIARSVVHNSMNYRSVVAFGHGEKLHDEEKKMAVFKTLSDKILPGRWEDCKLPTDSEMKMTAVIGVELEEASKKQRSGPPEDVKSDYELPLWAGVIPLKRTFGEPVDDPLNLEGVERPMYLNGEC